MNIAAIVDENVNPIEIETACQAFHEQSRRGAPSALTAFNYAHALVRSGEHDVSLGIVILEGLLNRGTEDVSRRDCLFYLAVAHTRQTEYDIALRHIDMLLNAYPHDRNAIDLRTLIESRMERNGAVGLTLGLGGIGIIAGIVALLFKLR